MSLIGDGEIRGKCLAMSISSRRSRDDPDTAVGRLGSRALKHPPVYFSHSFVIGDTNCSKAMQRAADMSLIPKPVRGRSGSAWSASFEQSNAVSTA